ncbi:MAG: M50 family metallopeptidase [Actinomycetia bacterium]|nr:M50 family metallopeptidase [Actinomycetes bacterium]
MSVGLSAVFWGVITLSVLVLLHEGGHFLAARAFGIRVREFMVGLPGPKISWNRKGTLYGVTAIPLGGYVKVVGMEGDQHNPLIEPVLAYITAKQTISLDDLATRFNTDANHMYTIIVALKDLQAVTLDKEGIIHASFPQDDAEDPDRLFETARADSYLTIPTWKRIAILLAGIIFNIVAALIVFTIVLAGWGTLQDVGLIDPVADSPAAQAGIPEGARITNIEGVGVSSFDELTTQIQTYQIGDSISLNYEFEGHAHEVTVQLARHPDSETPFLGVSPHFVNVPLSVGEALKMSFSFLWLTVGGIIGFFTPGNFSESINNSASVVGIAVYAAEAARAGAIEYAGLIAAISLSLGLMNLLPIPPLDGGKIVLEIIEKIRKKPLPMSVSLGISAIGFLLLFTLMGYLIFHDISRFIIGS